MNKDFINKYLSGDLDNSQVMELLNWVNSSKRNQEYFSKMKNIRTVSKLEQDNPDIDVSKEYEIFMHRLDQYTLPKKTLMKTWKVGNPELSIGNKLLRVAVVLLFLYSICGSLYYFINVPKVEYNEVSTRRGEKSQLVLSDGTRIWLNSESTLRYPANLKKSNVQVYLNGEAYFDVAKNPERKFIVNASSINIAVMGTSFNVKAYSDEKTVETTLEKGIISITGKIGNNYLKDPIVLKPNQRATFIKKTEEYSVSDISTESEDKNQINTETLNINKPATIPPKIILAELIDAKLYTSWKDGRLVFKCESFENLAQRMERWFDVRIEINDEELRRQTYTGVFEKETLEQALKALSLSLPFKYEIDHNVITIKK